MRHALPARQNFLDDQGEGDRSDDEVNALQPQRREADDGADHTGQQTGGEEIHRERNVELLQIRGRVGADRKECGVSERGLSGKSGQDQKRHADGRVNAYEDELADEITGEDVGRDDKQRHQRAVGPHIAGVGKQLYVVFVVGLEQEPHGAPLNLLAHGKAEQAFGPEQQDEQQHDIGRDVLPAFGQIEAGHALDHADQDATNDRAGYRAEAAKDRGRERLQAEYQADIGMDEGDRCEQHAGAGCDCGTDRPDDRHHALDRDAHIIGGEHVLRTGPHGGAQHDRCGNHRELVIGEHEATQPQDAVAERRFDLQIVGSPDHAGDRAQEIAEPDGRHDDGKLRIAEDRPHDQTLGQHAEGRHRQDRGGKADPVIEAQNADEGEGKEAAQHHQVALGEIHDFGRLVDKDKAERDQAIDTAKRNATHQLLNEVQHLFPSPDARQLFGRLYASPPFRLPEGPHIRHRVLSRNPRTLSTKRSCSSPTSEFASPDSPRRNIFRPCSASDANGDGDDFMTCDLSALQLRGLTKRFDRLAVDSLDLTVHAGEFYALVGPNGAGKTTTLRMVAGLLKPDAGTVGIFGIEALADPVAAKQVMAWFSDEPMIYDKLTPWEYLEFVGGLWGIEPKISHSRAQQLLSSLGLASHRHERCEGFSKGMRQKVALAGALVHDPRLIILDEPLTGLDAVSARHVKGLLTERVRAGCTVIMTTHILEVAERMADRIGVIASGRLVAEGTLAELRQQNGHTDTSLEDLFIALVDVEAAAA